MNESNLDLDFALSDNQDIEMGVADQDFEGKPRKSTNL